MPEREEARTDFVHDAACEAVITRQIPDGFMETVRHRGIPCRCEVRALQRDLAQARDTIAEHQSRLTPTGECSSCVAWSDENDHLRAALAELRRALLAAANSDLAWRPTYEQWKILYAQAIALARAEGQEGRDE